VTVTQRGSAQTPIAIGIRQLIGATISTKVVIGDVFIGMVVVTASCELSS